MLQLVGSGARFSEKHQKRMYKGHIKRCKQRPVNGAWSSVRPPAGGRMEEEKLKEKERMVK